MFLSLPFYPKGKPTNVCNNLSLSGVISWMLISAGLSGGVGGWMQIIQHNQNNKGGLFVALYLFRIVRQIVFA